MIQSTVFSIYLVMEKLFRAVFNGNEDLVSSIIASNPDLDLSVACDSAGRSLLYSACRGADANPSVVTQLLQAGASFQQTSTHTESLPQHAVVQNLKERLENGIVSAEFIDRLCTILLTLRKFYADFQHKNCAGLTALEEFEMLDVSGDPLTNRIRSALKQSDFFIIHTSFEGCEGAEATQIFADCCEYLKSNPLPYLVNLNIAQHLWNPFTNDDGCIINLANTSLERFCPETELALFKPQSMEILMDMNAAQRIKLRIHKWPNECGGQGGSVRVHWEWLLGGEWRRLEDTEVLGTLKSCSREIDHPPHSYQLDGDFVLRGDGPLDGAALRWLPSSEAGVHDDEGWRISCRIASFPHLDTFPPQWTAKPNRVRTSNWKRRYP